MLLFAPFGDDKRVSVTIRRFHSLRSFHPRLFTFAPFGDGRMLLAKLQLSNKRCLPLVIIEDQGEASLKTKERHHRRPERGFIEDQKYSLSLQKTMSFGQKNYELVLLT